MPRLFPCGKRELDLSQPCVMGVLNVTPDSFSDGGRYVSVGDALAQARRLQEEGANILDVGGESTRPGAQPVGEQQEMDRVLPVVERILREVDVCVSVDTSTPAVMLAAAAAGAHLINDVRALRREGALAAAAATGLPVCLMHMQGEPAGMQMSPAYTDVVAEVADFLEIRVAACVAAGISRERLLIDPGFGFGKTLGHNAELLRGLGRLKALGLPILAGLSRKSMIGHWLADARGPRAVDGRLFGSVAAGMLAVQNGASILRVHDVAATRDAWAVLSALKESSAV